MISIVKMPVPFVIPPSSTPVGVPTIVSFLYRKDSSLTESGAVPHYALVNFHALESYMKTRITNTLGHWPLYGECPGLGGYTLVRILEESFSEWQQRFRDGTTKRVLMCERRLSEQDVLKASEEFLTQNEKRLIWARILTLEHKFTPRLDGAGGSLLPKTPYRGGQTDGIDPDSHDILTRDDVLDRIISAWSLHQRILVRAPPSSGKTSICQLLEKRLVTSPASPSRTVYVSGLWIRQSKDFMAFWEQNFAVGWDEWSWQAVTTYLIVDEAQCLYGEESSSGACNSDAFWGALKGIVSRSKLHVALFSAYGYRQAPAGFATPISFDDVQCFSMPDLMIKFDEAVELAHIFLLNMKEGSIVLPSELPELARYLFLHTGGHIGLMRDALVHIVNRYRGKVGVTWPVLRKHLAGSDFVGGALPHFRGMPNVSNSGLGNEEFELLDQMLEGERVPFPAADDYRYPAASRLLVTGFAMHTFDINASLIKFPAPWITAGYLRYQCGHLQKAKVSPRNLKEFLTAVLRWVSPELLRLSLGRGTDGRLKEAAYQGEFYRAGWQAIPDRRGIISLEVGGLDGLAKEVDIAVQCDNKYWIVELLRDGNKAEDHLERMTASGAYGKLLAQANEFATIDLREEGTSPKRQKTHAGMTYVEFSKDFKTAFVTHPDGSQHALCVGRSVGQGVAWDGTPLVELCVDLG